MTKKKQETLRERMERIWRKRRPDFEDASEFTAEGKKTRTPTEDEFFGNLEKALDEPANELSHPRSPESGGSAKDD